MPINYVSLTKLPTIHKGMSQKYKVREANLPYFITVTVIDWVDIFTRAIYRDILDRSLNYCIKEKGLCVHAYVYMSNHIHLIVSSNDKQLEDIIRDFKKYTSKEIVKAIKEYPESRREWLLNKFSFAANRVKKGRRYKVWQDGFHPIVMDTYEKIEQRVSYIHYNPVDANLVYHERDWVHSSFAAYEEGNREHPNVKVSPLW